MLTDMGPEVGTNDNNDKKTGTPYGMPACLLRLDGRRAI
jgi:hypothetical protein